MSRERNKFITDRQGLSLPYDVATAEGIKEAIIQKISKGPAADPHYKILFDYLIDPTFKDHADFIKTLIEKIVCGLQNSAIQAYLAWVGNNFNTLPSSPAATPLQFVNNTVDLYIRSKENSDIGITPNINKYLRYLQNNYKRFNSLHLLFYREHPLPLADCYIHLALTKESEEQKQNKIEPERKHILKQYEEYDIKQAIEVENIFQLCPADSPRRILIEGAAGAGKSTLCQYIANEWATNLNSPWRQHYTWLFWIRLRDLIPQIYPDKGDDKQNIIQLLKISCFQPTLFESFEEDEVVTIIQQNKDSLLWILDGFDELHIQDCPHLQALWQTLSHPSQHCILTTRPHAKGIIKQQDASFNVEYAILGLSDLQITKYIGDFFIHIKYNNPQQASRKLLQQLQGDPNLWSLAHTPISLEFLCSLFVQDSLPENRVNHTTLYATIVDQLLYRYIKDKNKISNLEWTPSNRKKYRGEYQLYLEHLEYLAYLGMKQKSIVLRHTELDKALTFIEIKRKQANLTIEAFYEQQQALGIIKRYNDSQQAEFLHLTLQEYFAACYMAKHIQALSQINDPFALAEQQREIYTDILTFMTENKWNSFYIMMWRFVAGLLMPRDNQAAFQFMMDLFLHPPRDELKLRELYVLLTCLDEADVPTIKQKDILLQHLEQWTKIDIMENEIVSDNLLLLLPELLKSCPRVLWANGHLLVWLEGELQSQSSTFDRALKLIKDIGAKLASEVATQLLVTLLKLTNKNYDWDTALSAIASSLPLLAMKSQLLPLIFAGLKENGDGILAAHLAETIEPRLSLEEIKEQLLPVCLESANNKINSEMRETAIRILTTIVPRLSKEEIKLQLLPVCINALYDEDEDVVDEADTMFEAIINRLPKEAIKAELIPLFLEWSESENLDKREATYWVFSLKPIIGCLSAEDVKRDILPVYLHGIKEDENVELREAALLWLDSIVPYLSIEDIKTQLLPACLQWVEDPAIQSLEETYYIFNEIVKRVSPTEIANELLPKYLIWANDNNYAHIREHIFHLIIDTIDYLPVTKIRDTLKSMCFEWLQKDEYFVEGYKMLDKMVNRLDQSEVEQAILPICLNKIKSSILNVNVSRDEPYAYAILKKVISFSSSQELINEFLPICLFRLACTYELFRDIFYDENGSLRGDIYNEDRFLRDDVSNNQFKIQSLSDNIYNLLDEIIYHLPDNEVKKLLPIFETLLGYEDNNRFQMSIRTLASLLSHHQITYTWFMNLYGRWFSDIPALEPSRDISGLLITINNSKRLTNPATPSTVMAGYQQHGLMAPSSNNNISDYTAQHRSEFK